MPELTREDLYTALQPLQADLAALKNEVGTIKNDLGAMKSELAAVRIRTDDLPLMGAAIEAVQRDSRLLRAAIDDMSRTNITAGEVEAMHEDIDRVIARQADLEARLAALERHAPKP